MKPSRFTHLCSLPPGSRWGRPRPTSCVEEIVVPIDLAAGSRQDYVEDCPVCCCPNVIHVEIDDEGNVRVWAEGE